MKLAQPRTMQLGLEALLLGSRFSHLLEYLLLALSILPTPSLALLLLRASNILLDILSNPHLASGVQDPASCAWERCVA